MEFQTDGPKHRRFTRRDVHSKTFIRRLAPSEFHFENVERVRAYRDRNAPTVGEHEAAMSAELDELIGWSESEGLMVPKNWNADIRREGRKPLLHRSPPPRFGQQTNPIEEDWDWYDDYMSMDQWDDLEPLDDDTYDWREEYRDNWADDDAAYALELENAHNERFDSDADYYG